MTPPTPFEIANLQPVFLVGTPKSGTSFLYSLFDSHPNVVSLLETFAYSDSKRRLLDRYQEMRPFSSNKRNTDSREDESSFPRWLLSRIIQAKVDDGPAPLEQKTHLVEKSPNHYDHASEVFADFPNAKVIHLLRDPRDNYLSLKRRANDSENPRYHDLNYHPINFIGGRMIGSYEAAFRNVRKFGGKYRVLFYEDLIFGAESMMKEVVEWIGLPWNEALLKPTIDNQIWKGNSLADDLKGQLEPFDPRPIGRWKAALSDRERVLTEQIIWNYGLESRYAIEKRHSFMGLVMSIAMPLPDEVHREWQKVRASGFSPSEMARVIRHYWVSRRQILARITGDGVRSSGTPIIDAAFGGPDTVRTLRT